MRIYSFRSNEKQVIHDCELACRLPLAMDPHTLVDGGEVVQHPVRLVDFRPSGKRSAS